MKARGGEKGKKAEKECAPYIDQSEVMGREGTPSGIELVV